MKIFALRSGSVRREEKDLPDIAHLVLENGVDLEKDLKPVCDQFGTEAIYRLIRDRVEELSDD